MTHFCLLLHERVVACQDYSEKIIQDAVIHSSHYFNNISPTQNKMSVTKKTPVEFSFFNCPTISSRPIRQMKLPCLFWSQLMEHYKIKPSTFTFFPNFNIGASQDGVACIFLKQHLEKQQFPRLTSDLLI